MASLDFDEWDSVSKFEKLVSEYAGSKFAVATDCCTHSIFLSLQYLKIHDLLKTDTVDIPKMTYISVPSMVANSGLKIRFVDMEWSGSYRLSPTTVIDAAHRFREGMYQPGTLYCLSFHTKKCLPIGKGGMILTDDKVAYNWLTQARFGGRYCPFYSQLDPKKITVAGWHMHMTPEQATRGIDLFFSLPTHNQDTGKSSDKFDVSQCPAFTSHVVD